MCGYILGFDINWSNWCWEQNFLTLCLVPPRGPGAHEGKACRRKNWSFILLVAQEADAQRSLKVKDRSRLYWKWFSAPAGRWLSEDEYSLKRPSFEVAAGVYPSSASLRWNMAGSSHSPHGTVKSFAHANEPRWHPTLLYQGKHKVLTQITSAPEEHWTRSPTP